MKIMNFKKLLASIGLLAVAVPTTLSVVACGPANDSGATKTELKAKLAKLEIEASQFNEENTVFTEILKMNQDSGVTIDDVTSENFVAATEEADGILKIIAKKESNYQGDVTVKILNELGWLMKKVRETTPNTPERVTAWENYFAYKQQWYFDKYTPNNPLEFTEAEMENFSSEFEIKQTEVFTELLKKDLEFYGIENDYDLNHVYWHFSKINTLINESEIYIIVEGNLEIFWPNEGEAKISIEFENRIKGVIIDN